MFMKPLGTADAGPAARPSRPPAPAQLLACLQLADSAFPSGFYTLSHGLEGYAQAHSVTTDQIPALLADLLRHTVGPSDATALALAHAVVSQQAKPDPHSSMGSDPVEQLRIIDRKLFACKLNQGLRKAATRTGRQLLDLSRDIFSHPVLHAYTEAVIAKTTPGCQAVAAGVTYAAAGTDAEQAVLADLFAFSSSFVQAALKLRLTDHRRAQMILYEAFPVLSEVAQEAVARPLDELYSCSPLADVFSGQHENASARLFAT